MAERTLRDVLGALKPAGIPPSEVRSRREHLASFLRSVETRVFTASGPARATLRQLLGWDDSSLDAFIRSPLLVHTSTHVSMNAFAPMMAFPWFSLRLIATQTDYPDGGQPVHLRTQVTHNNLSDSRWKPNIWWHVGRDGEMTRTQLFSIGRRYKHQILLCQPVPAAPENLCDTDAEAVALAGHATNFAYFALIYRMAIERHARLHAPNSTVEVPVDLMNTYSLAGDGAMIWGRAMAEMGYTLRAIGTDNELHEVDRPPATAVDPLTVCSTLIAPNYLNIGQAYRLGLSVILGADRMSGYVSEMNEVIAAFLSRIGETAHTPLFLGVSRFDVDQLAPLPTPWMSDLTEQRGRPSLPLLVNRYGPGLVRRFDQALDRPANLVAQVTTIP